MQAGYMSCACCGKVYREDGTEDAVWAAEHGQPCPWWPTWRRIAWQFGYGIGYWAGTFRWTPNWTAAVILLACWLLVSSLEYRWR